jgi:hypothetical protein
MNSAARLRSPAGALRRALLASAVRRVMVTGSAGELSVGAAGNGRPGQPATCRRRSRRAAGAALGEPPARHSESRRRGTRGTAGGALAASCPRPPGKLLMPLQSIPCGLVSCVHQTSSVTTVTRRGRGSQRPGAWRRRVWRGVSGGANGAAPCERRGATGLFRGDRPCRPPGRPHAVGAIGALRVASQFT